MSSSILDMLGRAADLLEAANFEVARKGVPSGVELLASYARIESALQVAQLKAKSEAPRAQDAITHRVTSPADLGALLRATRKSSPLRQDDFAGLCGVTHVFVRHAEQGKPTAQIGKMLYLADQLGIRLYATTPMDVAGQLAMAAKLKGSGSEEQHEEHGPLAAAEVRQQTRNRDQKQG